MFAAVAWGGAAVSDLDTPFTTNVKLVCFPAITLPAFTFEDVCIPLFIPCVKLEKLCFCGKLARLNECIKTTKICVRLRVCVDKKAASEITNKTPTSEKHP